MIFVSRDEDEDEEDEEKDDDDDWLDSLILITGDAGRNRTGYGRVA
jgi:hypothetical protein